MGGIARVAVALAGIAALGAGCFSEAAGSQVWGVNESDRDVIVSSPVHASSVRLPAHTWGKLFDAYRAPAQAISVFDSSCGVLATLPLQVPRATVHITAAGAPEMIGEPPGVVPATVHRAGTDAGGHDSFAPVTCP